MQDRFFFLGAVVGLLGVASGAFGGHLLKPRLSPEFYAIFEVASRYHMYHALALLGAAWACSRWPGTWTTLAGWLFFWGTLLFSGSLYLLSFTGLTWLGAITPVGGTALMAGWLCLARAVWRA